MESLFTPVGAYVSATSFWYFTRACARLAAPETVHDWFRAGTRGPNALEIYNIRTDALGLALCALLVILIPQLPLKSTASPSSPFSPRVLALLGSAIQHLGTAYYAYYQWDDASTTTGAMLLGWTVSSALGLFGFIAAISARSDKRANLKVK